MRATLNGHGEWHPLIAGKQCRGRAAVYCVGCVRNFTANGAAA